MVSNSGKTAIIGDPDDEGRHNDELELDLDDDNLKLVEDEKVRWVQWTEPMTVDLEVAAYTPDGGRDIDQRPCPEVEGMLLRRAGDHLPGELVRITGGQVILARKLKKADPQVGQRLVVKYVGLVKTKNGHAKDFQVLVGPAPAPRSRPAQSETPPF